jgi:hypothetical protein
MLTDWDNNIYDPYLATVLPDLNLSNEAQKVLDHLNFLFDQSLDYRDDIYMWDAGIYQLKNLWREHFPDDWIKFRELCKNLESKLSPGVYDFGFLRP